MLLTLFQRTPIPFDFVIPLLRPKETATLAFAGVPMYPMAQRMRSRFECDIETLFDPPPILGAQNFASSQDQSIPNRSDDFRWLEMHLKNFFPTLLLLGL